MSTIHLAADVLAVIPNPGQGSAPPGSGGVMKILGWCAWIVFGAIVAGVLMVAGRMALAHRRGEGVEVSGGLVMTLAAAIIAGSASALVGAVLV
jgi:hypothetical protein